MQIKMPSIPKSNRAYTLAYVAIICMTVLCGLVIWKVPNQWKYALEWYSGALIYIIPIVIGVKEVGKVAGKWGDGYISKQTGIAILNGKEIKGEPKP